MLHINKWIVIVALVCTGLLLGGCQKHDSAHHKDHPAEVEPIEGTKLKKVTLTEKAAQRIDVRTEKVREEKGQKVVPYSSLIYDPQGQTWVYVSPAPRTFMRHKVEVDRIVGDMIYLNDGPPAGTVIASVAVAELYGTESGVGH